MASMTRRQARYTAGAILLQAAAARWSNTSGWNSTLKSTFSDNTSYPTPYKLTDYYNPTNFWDRWWFRESKPGTGDPNDVDPTHGFVMYQNRSEAERLRLVQNWPSDMYIGVETATSLDPNGLGRKSIRLESETRYNHGLFIADFTYLPPPRCGIWPAFWMYGPAWPNSGEVDIIEQWNDYPFNRQTLHTASANVSGTCNIHQSDMQNRVETTDCAVDAAGQKTNQGCSADDLRPYSPYGSAYGGVYATEWTSKGWRLWAWPRFSVPHDVRVGTPDPRRWGKPQFASRVGECDVDRAFKDHRLVLNIDFCGDTAGSPDEWNKTCRQATGYDTCAGWVAAHPEAFTDVYWRVRSIDVYTKHGE